MKFHRLRSGSGLCCVSLLVGAPMRTRGPSKSVAKQCIAAIEARPVSSPAAKK